MRAYVKLWSAVGHTPITERNGAYCDTILETEFVVADEGQARREAEHLLETTEHAARGYFECKTEDGKLLSSRHI